MSVAHRAERRAFLWFVVTGYVNMLRIRDTVDLGFAQVAVVDVMASRVVRTFAGHTHTITDLVWRAVGETEAALE